MCGEPCPPQCRICNKRIVKEIFFGTEDEPDARFVFLPDCRHLSMFFEPYLILAVIYDYLTSRSNFTGQIRSRIN
jgi:hypothetical protein